MMSSEDIDATRSPHRRAIERIIDSTRRYNATMADEKPTSRREFLRGRAAARSLLGKLESLADRAASILPPVDATTSQGPSAAASSAHAKLNVARRAMACEFAIQYHAADGATANDAVLAALDLVDQLESQLTIYRDSSEVIEINRRAAEEPVAVEPQLFALLELCVWLHAETRGAFDLTSGPLSRVWGFLRREGRVPADSDVAAALAQVGGHKLALDRAAHTIQFTTPGVEINLNAVGKGYALDRVVQRLADRGVDDVLCHGGRSSVSARGRDRADDCGGWRIGVPHPLDLERTVGEIVLRDEALGTSGAGTQFFEVDGRRYGHLIDPRSGRPADGVYTATVVAPTGAEADALSTALYVMGPGGASEYCAAHPGIAAVLVCPRDESTTEFDVHAFNLDSTRWRPQ
jgi:thiamine biosynthesis lipoprotein